MRTQAIRLGVVTHHGCLGDIKKVQALNLASANPPTGLPLTGLLSLSIGDRDLSLESKVTQVAQMWPISSLFPLDAINYKWQRVLAQELPAHMLSSAGLHSAMQHFGVNLNENPMLRSQNFFGLTSVLSNS